MKSIQKTGRTVGFLLFLIMAIGIPSVILRGLSTSMTASPDFLLEIYNESQHMRIAILLDILTSFLWVVIAIILFPVIKTYRSSLALWFFGIWAVQLAVIVSSDITHLALLSLSQEYVNTNVVDKTHFSTLGLLKIETYFWAHFMSLMLYAAATFSCYFFLFKTKLIPKLLSIWGMIAISLVFVASWLNIFDVDISFHFFSQNGLFMIVLTGWLIAKGFNPKVPFSKAL